MNIANFVNGLLLISRAIDRFSKLLGVIATHLVLYAALVSAFNAIVRYSINGLLQLSREFPRFTTELGWLFDLYRNNSNTFGESQWYMFAAIVMLGAPYTLRRNEHVRVDIVYGQLSERSRIWIDLLGGILFLMPMCVLMFHFTWPWFLESFREGEMSANAGGLPRWPVKLILPAGFAFLGLQGISEIMKCVAALMVARPRDHRYERPIQ